MIFGDGGMFDFASIDRGGAQAGGDGRSPGSRLSARTAVGPVGFTDRMEITRWEPPVVCEVAHLGTDNDLPNNKARNTTYAGRFGVALGHSTELAHEVVARMDADDIAHPDRLKRQFEIINSSSEIVVVGTLCDGIDACGRVVRPRDRWRYSAALLSRG